MRYTACVSRLGRIARLAAVRAFVRADRWVYRAISATEAAASGFLAVAVPREEQSGLSLAVYDAIYGESSGLFLWEREWFERRLPSAPARVLVAAAGLGREVGPLLERGYEVDAFEPVSRMATQCRVRLGDRGVVADATFEAVSSAILDGKDGPAAVFRGRRYDAVLLGFGSFSHVLEDEARLRTLLAFSRLCPTGPLLVSFVLRSARSGDSRALGWGQAVGRFFGGVVEEGRFFNSGSGFSHGFSREEIARLAERIDRRIEWDCGESVRSYPHVTLLAR